MDKTGVIYILTNPSFPEYVKIGYADDIDKRLQQLNRSECIHCWVGLHVVFPLPSGSTQPMRSIRGFLI